MILNRLYKNYNSIKDVKLIGREIATENKICEVIGFYLCNSHLQLSILEYDQEQIENEMEQDRLCYDYEREMTNRIQKQKSSLRNFHQIVNDIKEVIVDGMRFEVEESGGTRVQLSDCENTLLFSQFFQKGWKPKSIGSINLEHCFICTIMLKGKFDEIPHFRENPHIIFKNRDTVKAELVEQPITLEVGKVYDEKIYFKTKEKGEGHWVYINSVNTVDIFAETMKKFENPKFKEQLSEEEFQKMKSDTEKRILKVCPKGKRFLSVEYESDTDEQIDFYAKEWLESEPIHTNSATTFMVIADKKTGKLGKPLRVALIEEPLDLSVKSVKAEIFCMFKKIENGDIELAYEVNTDGES